MLCVRHHRNPFRWINENDLPTGEWIRNYIAYNFHVCFHFARLYFSVWWWDIVCACGSAYVCMLFRCKWWLLLWLWLLFFYLTWNVYREIYSWPYTNKSLSIEWLCDFLGKNDVLTHLSLFFRSIFLHFFFSFKKNWSNLASIQTCSQQIFHTTATIRTSMDESMPEKWIVF